MDSRSPLSSLLPRRLEATDERAAAAGFEEPVDGTAAQLGRVGRVSTAARFVDVVEIGRGCETVLADVLHEHRPRGAVGNKAERDRPADPARASGDQHRGSLEDHEVNGLVDLGHRRGHSGRELIGLEDPQNVRHLVVRAQTAQVRS